MTESDEVPELVEDDAELRRLAALDLGQLRSVQDDLARHQARAAPVGICGLGTGEAADTAGQFRRLLRVGPHD